VGIRDIEALMRQLAADYDPNVDASVGSPFDAKVIQPIVRRLGVDPFSVDLATFIVTRLRQAYPKMAVDEGDNISDMIVKPNTLLFDPLVRETTRVRRGMSFADPQSLTFEEVDALGANHFIPRRRGQYTRGPVRLFFGKPQNVDISQNNFVTSRGGLVYFPTALQSIRSAEMLLNVSGNNFYFDFNVIASEPGTAYNIGPNEIISIANITSASRVTNLRRFRKGEDEETAEEYVGRLEATLGEKSMVAIRGIAAKLLEGFPEINRLNVIGQGDPEMRRDIITGGGLGQVLASGNAGVTISDGEGNTNTRRFYTTEADFSAIVGDATNLVLTVFGAFGAVVSSMDLDVLRVPEMNTVDTVNQEFMVGLTGLSWSIRRRELTLSGIPGGILFPDNPNGTVSILEDEVHVGGMYDVYTRTTDFDDASLSLSNLTDDDPLLSGIQAIVESVTLDEVHLYDLVLGTDYEEDDETYRNLENAAFRGYMLQLQNETNAGTYRVLGVQQVSGQPAVVQVTPLMTVIEPLLNVRWRLFDELNISLTEPRETKLSGTDLVTTQGSDEVTTAAGLNFDEYGVATGDILRLLDGVDAGDYSIISDPLLPAYDRLQIDTPFPHSLGSANYEIYRPAGDGVQLPLVRIRSIELVDSSSQPQGSTIPYAKPVDVQSRSFQNPARGVKHEYSDVRLGLVSAETNASGYFDVGPSDYLWVWINDMWVLFSGFISTIQPTLDVMISDLNNKFLMLGFPAMVVKVNERRFGIRPEGNGLVGIYPESASVALFGNQGPYGTADVRSADAEADGGWANLDPVIDSVTGLDVLEIVDGKNSGFYASPFYLGITGALIHAEDVAALNQGEATYFMPEANRKIRIGARSLGSVRVYFLEPTSFEVDGDTLFSLDMEELGIANFVPDPTLWHQQIPTLPDGDMLMDGTSIDGASLFTSSSQDFLLSGIKAGDELIIERMPIRGTQELTDDPVVGLVGKTFIFSINNGTDKVVTFVRDDASLNPDEVSKAGVPEQINAAAGVEVASIDTQNRLKFTTEYPFVVRRDGTANDDLLENVDGLAGPVAFSDADQSNTSPHAGEYTVSAVGTTTLTISGTFPNVAEWGNPVEQSFRVRRAGIQRISTTEMAENQAEAGLYFFDVELISEGAGDFWNIDSGQQLMVAGYRSDGWYLTTEDENLTFSEVEEPSLVISRSILEPGVEDDPQNATQITGQNIQIEYDRSSTVGLVQSFASSEVERVVCSNPLSRHLLPHFVRFDMTYTGGSRESVVVPEVEKYIRELFPVDSLDSSDVQKRATDRGATYVQNPIDLIAIVHNVDRSVWAQRSQDRLSTGRLSAFIPDRLNITRNVT